MEEAVVTKLPSKGGRPRKYATNAERQAAHRAHEKQRKLDAAAAEFNQHAVLFPEVANITAASPPADINAAIAKAVADLPLPDARFVTEVCGGLPMSKAYKLAHPAASEAHAAAKGSAKAAEPAVAKALAEVKRHLAATMAYKFEVFMAELDAAILFAQKTNNATAYVRAVELKGKSTGHLSDKPAGGASNGFTLNIVGIDNPATFERAE